MNTSTTSDLPSHRVADAERAALARTREASIAREALSAATRAEALARDAVDAADALAAAAAEQHAAAVTAAEKAEAAYTSSQTAASWSGVERARSLRDQADVRRQVTAAAREGAAAEALTARQRVEAARAEVERADASVARAADVVLGVQRDATLADDAAAARAGARAREVDAVRAEFEAFTAAAVEALSPLLARFARTVAALHEAEAAVAAASNDLRVRAAALRARGDAVGAFDGTPWALAFETHPQVLAVTVAHRALTPRLGATSQAMQRMAWGGLQPGGGMPTEREVIDAAVASLATEGDA